MKKKLICLLLVLAMAAPLCACSMLDKEYVSIHDYVPSEQEQSLTGGKLTVHSYNALRAAILNMAYEGRSTGTIVFDPAYEGDPAEDLATACWTVRTEDALCAYCVENISYDFNKIVTVNEASIKLSYSKATESPKQIVHLGFSSEAEGAIVTAMENGVRTLALLVGRSGFSAEDMAAKVSKAYRDNPTVVPKKPTAVVNVFSGAGAQRLYELQIDYGMTNAQLIRCRRELAEFEPFDESKRSTLTEVERAYAACRYLVENCSITDKEEADSAYSALIRQEANSEGLAFGYVALCRMLNVDARIVYGQHDRQEHCWNIVRIDDNYYHVDITQCAKGGPALGFMQNDETFWGIYRWDVAAYPRCSGKNSFFDFFPPVMIDNSAAGEKAKEPNG